MASEIALREIDAQPVAVIRLKTTMDKLAEVMGPTYGEIMGTVQQAGLAPTGMPLARYYGIDGNDVDLECGIPIPSIIEPRGRVTSCELPAGRVATAIHIGPYDELRRTWAHVMEWVQSEGLTTNAPPWEVYVDDPTTVAPSELRTEIYVPVT